MSPAWSSTGPASPTTPNGRRQAAVENVDRASPEPTSTPPTGLESRNRVAARCRRGCSWRSPCATVRRLGIPIPLPRCRFGVRVRRGIVAVRALGGWGRRPRRARTAPRTAHRRICRGTRSRRGSGGRGGSSGPMGTTRCDPGDPGDPGGGVRVSAGRHGSAKHDRNESAAPTGEGTVHRTHLDVL